MNSTTSAVRNLNESELKIIDHLSDLNNSILSEINNLKTEKNQHYIAASVMNIATGFQQAIQAITQVDELKDLVKPDLLPPVEVVEPTIEPITETEPVITE